MDHEDDDIKRLRKLDNSLSESDRLWIISQWDFRNGLDSWQARLRKKENAPMVTMWREIYITIAVIISIIIGLYFQNYYRNAQDARSKLKYIYDNASENKELSTGLKWIEERIKEEADDIPIEDKGTPY